ncbi:APO protein 2, chloroplastic isoform X2 [Humulus lupulus]|uniref:APO protein 2, chloroplastic isoform X2 n=1 Tax=Humulus lupulus TaxID=3486 RepID=UPI002B4120C4|nr:APO protein 2, chloroplastic isoform X2 [Humulus lupulus]
MECGSCSSSVGGGARALWCGKGLVSTHKMVPFRISLGVKSEFLKFNPCPGLGFLYSMQHSNHKIKVQLKSSQKMHPSYASVIKAEHPQNTDLPRYYSRKEKKPFPVPIVELRRAARERIKKRKGQPRRPVPPPKNGMLVKSFIPIAYDVYNSRIALINNLKKLLRAVPVHACNHRTVLTASIQLCRYCNEIHVGPTGHPFRSCTGQNASARRGLHDWTTATVEDIFLPVEAYHLYDRLGKRIPHDQRFAIPRIPALVELCIQAGVDIPDFPTKRRRKPIIRINKSEFVDADESELPDPDPKAPKPPILTEIPDFEIVGPSNEEETTLLAEETLQVWEKMRKGAQKLMKLYPVRVCGYCPELHIGPSGHKAQNCGAHKHQQRNGQHGWQSAVIDDLIPPRYVWHVPDVNGPPLQRELRSFYGQGPAVVEMCMQAGAAVPEQFRGTMRLDVGIPTDPKEAEMVV